MKHQPDRTGRTAVLLEPHPICHAAIRLLLGRIDISLVGAATTADEAAALLGELVPSLLVVEPDLPEGREAALRMISRGRREHPALTVIVLSGTDDSGLIEDAFAAGASTYILKTADSDAVATAIRQALEPKASFPRPSGVTVGPVSADRIVPQLTRRELEILQLVSEGRSNRQVGQLLWVTDQTVKFHLANIYRKLGVGSRYDAARWAQENGVLEAALEEVEGAEIVPLAETNGNGNSPATNGNGAGSVTGNGSGATPLRLRRTTPGGLRSRAELREGTSQ